MLLVLSTKPKANSEGRERRGLQRLVQQDMQEVEKQQVSKKSPNKTEFGEKRGAYREERGCGPLSYFATAVLKHHGQGKP